MREYVNLLSDAELGSALKNLAPELLSDVDEDTVLDYGDILSWNRRSAAVFVGDKAALDSLALAMAMGESQETVQARAMAVTSSKAPSGVALAFYLANISSAGGTGNCLQCHSPGGRASGTRLVLVSERARNVDAINFTAFAELVAKIGAGAVLHKTRGGEGHEGGRRLIPDSDEFRNFEIFLNIL